MNETHSGADAIVEILERHDVDHVFGLCGHTIVALLAALEASSIRFVGVHHEQTAAHAADGYARVSGRPGVVLTHLGPGFTNALTGVANAAFDNVPLVLIAGNVQSYFYGRHAHMETTFHGDADQAGAAAPFVKRTWRVTQPAALVPALTAALRLAQTAPQGPVLLDVAMDVFSAPVDLPDAQPPAEPPSAAGLDPVIAQRMAHVLATAQRPLLYLGARAAHARAGKAAVEIAELLGASIVYGLMGKGTVPDEHVLNLGVSGLWGTPAANDACRSADVVLALGAEFGELDSSSWKPGTTFGFPPSRLLHVHDDPAEIGRTYRPELGAVADARLAAEAIAAQLRLLGDEIDSSPDKKGRREELARLQRQFAGELAEACSSTEVPMAPARVLADLRRTLPEGTIIVGDTGWNKNGIAQQWPTREPSDFVVPGGYATMGFGPSAALGCVRAAPDRRVLALVGDGAFLTNLSVVVTAVEEELPVVWAVMNNSAYATISGMEQRHFGTAYGATFSTERLDYAGFARAVGAEGARVEDVDQLGPLVRSAFEARRPFVLDIPCTTAAVPTTGHWDINALFAAASPAYAR